MATNKKEDRISVVVPVNPFTPADAKHVKHCLCALDVEKLMDWWPGLPHSPHRDPKKVKAIQRSLDWKRVAQIAAYLVQDELSDVGGLLDEVFGPIYEPRKNEPGREWPPSVRGTIKPAKSSFPFFSNILVHVNGAQFHQKEGEIAEISLNPETKGFYLTVVDGQHRVNGAYLALMLRRKVVATPRFDLPAEIFLDLDPVDKPPVRQAQIFIDVNLYQKKVDRSLVADLFPLARGDRSDLDRKDRAQDVGRKLMLETGPLVGMIQIPGIRYGVKDVVTLATLNGAIESALPALEALDVSNLEAQTAFLAQLFECWLDASGRAEHGAEQLSPDNVAYQGRILVSVIDLAPAVLALLKAKAVPLVSAKARTAATTWLRRVIHRAGLLKNGQFVAKGDFREMGFLGSGGIGRFRDRLWAASMRTTPVGAMAPEGISQLAAKARKKANRAIGGYAG